MAKTFLTYQQQLHILEHDKQLAIPDSDYAKKMLEEISYYSLIGGYKSLFKHNASNKYAHGVTFDELVSFYYFDEELRTLFLKYILHVERHMKSMFSYHFCEKYGEQIYLAFMQLSSQEDIIVFKYYFILSSICPVRQIIAHIKKI